MSNKTSNKDRKTSQPDMLVIIGLVAAVIGVFLSYTLIKEDVYSTAKTLFEYFPEKYGVTPASTMDGALRLGRFVSIVQIITGAIAFKKGFSLGIRLLAGLLFFVTFPFDSWTDVVFRSGGLQGDIGVAVTTTFMFYTVGSELTQTFAWILIFSTWRQGVREIMKAIALTQAGLETISDDWSTIRRNASFSAQRDVTKEDVEEKPVSSSGSGQSDSDAIKKLKAKSQPQVRTEDRRQEHPASRAEPTYHAVTNRTEEAVRTAYRAAETAGPIYRAAETYGNQGSFESNSPVIHTAATRSFE